MRTAIPAEQTFESACWRPRKRLQKNARTQTVNYANATARWVMRLNKLKPSVMATRHVPQKTAAVTADAPTGFVMADASEQQCISDQWKQQEHDLQPCLVSMGSVNKPQMGGQSRRRRRIVWLNPFASLSLRGSFCPSRPAGVVLKTRGRELASRDCEVCCAQPSRKGCALRSRMCPEGNDPTGRREDDHCHEEEQE